MFRPLFKLGLRENECYQCETFSVIDSPRVQALPVGDRWHVEKCCFLNRVSHLSSQWKKVCLLIVYISLVLFRAVVYALYILLRPNSVILRFLVPISAAFIYLFSRWTNTPYTGFHHSVPANAHIHWQRMTCQTVLQTETRTVKEKCS